MSRCMVNNKVIFANQLKADEAALRIAQERNTQLRTYFCGGCNGYHLTRRASLLEQQTGTREDKLQHTSLNRERRSKKAEHLCNQPIPRDGEQVKTMLLQIEELRAQINKDYKLLIGSCEEPTLRSILSHLKTRRDALRFVLKKMTNMAEPPPK